MFGSTERSITTDNRSRPLARLPMTGCHRLKRTQTMHLVPSALWFNSWSNRTSHEKFHKFHRFSALQHRHNMTSSLKNGSDLENFANDPLSIAFLLANGTLYKYQTPLCKSAPVLVNEHLLTERLIFGNI